jgi:hypothetical protein
MPNLHPDVCYQTPMSIEEVAEWDITNRLPLALIANPPSRIWEILETSLLQDFKQPELPVVDPDSLKTYFNYCAMEMLPPVLNIVPDKESFVSYCNVLVEAVGKQYFTV